MEENGLKNFFRPTIDHLSMKLIHFELNGKLKKKKKKRDRLKISLFRINLNKSCT